jgi:hypothetical protein
MITKKTWEEFRSTGLLLFVNQVLHVFGWAIVFNYNDETNELEEVYPARVKFRGFDDKSVSESYEKITDYLHKNINELKEEIKD